MRGTPVGATAQGTTSATATFLVSASPTSAFYAVPSNPSATFYVTDIVVFSDITTNVRLETKGTNAFLTRVQGSIPFYASFAQPIVCGTSVSLGAAGNTNVQISMYGFMIQP